MGGWFKASLNKKRDLCQPTYRDSFWSQANLLATYYHEPSSNSKDTPKEKNDIKICDIPTKCRKVRNLVKWSMEIQVA